MLSGISIKKVPFSDPHMVGIRFQRSIWVYRGDNNGGYGNGDDGSSGLGVWWAAVLQG